MCVYQDRYEKEMYLQEFGILDAQDMNDEDLDYMVEYVHESTESTVDIYAL